jgi:hypothetical protein
MCRIRKELDARHASNVDHPAHALVERDGRIQKNLTGSNVGRGRWEPISLATATEAYLADRPFVKGAETVESVGDAKLAILKAAERYAAEHSCTVEVAALRVWEAIR